MIRLRHAFILLVVGTLAAFSLGLFIGYSAARNSLLAEGMEKWVNDMSLPASVVNRRGSPDIKPGPVSVDVRGSSDSAPD
jgi:hypothetical protein